MVVDYSPNPTIDIHTYISIHLSYECKIILISIMKTNENKWRNETNQNETAAYLLYLNSVQILPATDD